MGEVRHDPLRSLRDRQRARAQDARPHLTKGWSKPGYTDNCTGSKAARTPCGPFFYQPFEYSTDSMPEGIVPINATAEDIVGNRADVASWQVKIDRTEPLVGLSGAFSERSRGQTLSGPSPLPLDVDAVDWIESNDDIHVDAGTGTRSGVKDIEIKVDGERAFYASQQCPQNNCAMRRTWDFLPAAYSPGTHRVEVLVTDHAENLASETWAFRVARSSEPLPPDVAALDSGNSIKVLGASSGDYAGQATANVGDINEDGAQDFAVSAPGTDHGGRTDAGSVFVVYGGAGAPRTVDLSQFGPTLGFRIQGARSGDFAGTTVSKAGDVNGDGLDDLIVGAGRFSPGGVPSIPATPGAAFVVFGRRGSADDIDLASLGSSGFRINGPPPSTLGMSVPGLAARGFGGAASTATFRTLAGNEDFNGDGLSDMVLGSPTESGGAGAAYVVFGKAGSEAVDVSALGSRGFRIEGTPGDNAGYAVATIGDMNDDDTGELLITAPGKATPGRTFSGSAYVVFGKGTSTDVSLGDLAGKGFRIDGASGDRLGASASEFGDLNGDGRQDMLLGGSQATVAFGKGGDGSLDLASLTRSQGYRVRSTESSDAVSVSGSEDLNGDGAPEVIVGDPSANDRGWVGVVFGSVSAETRDIENMGGHLGLRREASNVRERAGANVTAIDNALGAGDIDFLAGAPGASARGVNSGMAYITPGVDRSDCTQNAPTLDRTYVYFCGSLGGQFAEPADEPPTTATPMERTAATSSDPRAQTADDSVGFVRNDFKWELGAGTEPYRIIAPDGRTVAKGRVLEEAIIRLDGINSLTEMSLEHKSGQAIRQLLIMVCKRNRRVFRDPECNTGSEDSRATGFNRGRHRLPSRRNSYVVKRNVSGNKYFYRFRYFLRPTSQADRDFGVSPFAGWRSADFVCKDHEDDSRAEPTCEF